MLLRRMCDALIDQGANMTEASQLVARELVDCRYPSAWLKSPRTLQHQQGQTAAAAVDLQAAINELNVRIHPDRPDLGLLVERGRTALLGDFQLARADLQRAEGRHARLG